jgi:hypothetical protein
MAQSHIIEVGGMFVGAAVRTPELFRFIAVDPRVEELDHTEWPSLADVHRVVGHMIRTGSLPPAPGTAS